MTSDVKPSIGALLLGALVFGAPVAGIANELHAKAASTSTWVVFYAAIATGVAAGIAFGLACLRWDGMPAPRNAQWMATVVGLGFAVAVTVFPFFVQGAIIAFLAVGLVVGGVTLRVARSRLPVGDRSRRDTGD